MSAEPSLATAYGRELFVLYPTLGPVHTGLVESNEASKNLGAIFLKKKKRLRQRAQKLRASKNRGQIPEEIFHP